MDKLLIHANNEYKFNEHIRVGVDLFYHNYSKMEIVMILFRFSNFCSKTDPISAAWDKDREFFGEVYFTYGTNPAFSAYRNQYKESSSHSFC